MPELAVCMVCVVTVPVPLSHGQGLSDFHMPACLMQTFITIHVCPNIQINNLREKNLKRYR